ncbi:MAG: dihydropteroate synthase, partial [Advenella sp.]
MNHSTFICGRFELTLKRPLVMGIVNVTPDSFSDGAVHFSAEAATRHAHELIAQG